MENILYALGMSTCEMYATTQVHEMGNESDATLRWVGGGKVAPHQLAPLDGELSLRSSIDSALERQHA